MDDSVISAISGLGLLVAGGAIGHTLALHRCTMFINDLKAHLHKEYQERLSNLSMAVVTSAFFASGLTDIEGFCRRLQKEAKEKFDLHIEPTIIRKERP